MTPSPGQLAAALAVAARIVARDGARFVPVFLAMEAAQPEQDATTAALARAMNAARAA